MESRITPIIQHGPSPEYGTAYFSEESTGKLIALEGGLTHAEISSFDRFPRQHRKLLDQLIGVDRCFSSPAANASETLDSDSSDEGNQLKIKNL